MIGNEHQRLPCMAGMHGSGHKITPKYPVPDKANQALKKSVACDTLFYRCPGQQGAA